MKLYQSPTSPYVRKVLVLLHETGQTADVTLVPSSTAPTNPVPGLAAKNPLMKIPALERNDGAMRAGLGSAWSCGSWLASTMCCKRRLPT